MGELDGIIFEEQFQLDAWTALDYKRVIPSKHNSGLSWMAPDWMGEHRRRVSAYTALLAYRDNAARLLLRALSAAQLEERADRREYGDAALLIESIRSAVIGDDQSVVTQGADEFDEDKPTPEAQAAADRQEFLRQWAEEEQLITKLIETERNAVSMGDGVYLEGWDAERKRVFLRPFDPSCYFPVLDDGDESQFPRKVHLAWELVNDDPRDSTLRIRKLTYELRDVEPYSVPWEDELATKACFYTDAVYEIDGESRSPEDLTKPVFYSDDSEGEVRDRNLGIDYIPIIHIPNTVAVQNHYGRSSLLNVLQVIDDVQATDSDLQKASALTGGPMLAVSGSQTAGQQFTVGPNEALVLGESGSAEMLSGSEGLEALAAYLDRLLKRLTTNARTTAAALGLADPKDFASGVHLQLSYGPLKAMVDEMRLVRRDPYRLVFKFAQRFYLKEGLLDGPVIDTDLAFGSFLPSDVKATVDVVIALRTAVPPLISSATAMKMLQEVGVPIDDPAAEQAEIDKRDYESAIKLLEATGNEKAVNEMLGVESGRPDEPDESGLVPSPTPPAPTTPDQPLDE